MSLAAQTWGILAQATQLLAVYNDAMPSIDEIIVNDPQPIDPASGRAKVVGNSVFLTGLTESQKQVRYVSSGFFGIIMAGAAYPLVLGVLATLVTLTSMASALPSLSDLAIALVSALVSTFILLVIGGTCGLILGTFAAALAVPVVIAVNRTIGNPISARSATICAGSIAGYLPTAWVMFTPLFGADLLGTIATLFFGPGLAMTMGAYGAAKSSAAYSKIKPAEAATSQRQPLSIRHLMMGTAWVAVTLSIGNYFGGLGFVIAVAVWFGLQALMLAAVNLLPKLTRRKTNGNS